MPNNHAQPLVPPHGKKFELDAYAPGYSGDLDRARAEAEIVGLRLRLNVLQDLLYADRRYSLLIVLQGIDTAGKDGTIKSVFQQVGPLGCSVANFGVPTDEELGHDFLWRYHQRTPRKGQVVIFNRSHYEAVLVERVKNRKLTDDTVAGVFATMTRDNLIARLNDSDIAFAEVNTMDDLSKHPHLRRIEVGTPNGVVAYPAPASIVVGEKRPYGAVPPVGDATGEISQGKKP